MGRTPDVHEEWIKKICPVMSGHNKSTLSCRGRHCALWECVGPRYDKDCKLVEMGVCTHGIE